jgi:hypothetical protein
MPIPTKNIRAERITGSFDADSIEISGTLDSISATSFTGSFSGDGTNLIIDYDNLINIPPLDTTPTSGSLNAVTSDGIKSALDLRVPYTGSTDNVNLGEFGLSTGFITFDTTPTNTPQTQGTAFWDEDDNTLDIILNGYTMKVGEDQFYPVKNQTGSNIPKGTAVRFAGTVGTSGRLLIAPFLADGSVPSTFFMGITAENINNGDDGKVLWFGRLRGLNTNSFNEGDILYASPTVAGGLTTVIPTAPNNIIQVAAVITKSINQGTIFIRPTFSSNINKDEGVVITNPQDKDVLIYNDNTELWENGKIDYDDLDNKPNLNLSTFTIDLTDELTVDFYAPYNLKINTITNIVNSPTVILKVNDVVYTLEDLILQGDKITVEADINGVINLNVEYE